MHQPKTIPSNPSTSSTPADVESSATEQRELAERIEQIESEFLRLENQFLELEGKYHRFALDFEKSSNAPLRFSIDALDRIAKLEARLDSAKLSPVRQRPSRTTTKRHEAA